MKTLKITILAMLLASTVVAFSNPIFKAKKPVTNQQELFKNFKSKLFIWGVDDCIGCGNSVDLVVYCKVNSENNIEIWKLVGDNEDLKMKIISIINDHPIAASSELKGKIMAFKLHIEIL